jgi:hypothetical protein
MTIIHDHNKRSLTINRSPTHFHMHRNSIFTGSHAQKHFVTFSQVQRFTCTETFSQIYRFTSNTFIFGTCKFKINGTYATRTITGTFRFT